MSIDDREQERAEVHTEVRLRSPSLSEFQREHSDNLSEGGVFVRSDVPMAKFTLVKLELVVDDETYVEAVGRVVWTRGPEAATDDEPAGMGIKFVKLEAESRDRLRALVEGRGSAESLYDSGLRTLEVRAEDLPRPDGASGEAGEAEPGTEDETQEESAMAKDDAEEPQEAEPEVPEDEEETPPPSAFADTVEAPLAPTVKLEEPSAEAPAKKRRKKKKSKRKASGAAAREGAEAVVADAKPDGRAGKKKRKKGRRKTGTAGPRRPIPAPPPRAEEFGWTDAATLPLLVVLLVVVSVAVWWIFFPN